MHNNRYTDIVDHWKIDLLRIRARRLGIGAHDIQEAEQEIAPLLATFRFDPTNGATERTALTRVIDNRLKNVKRRSARYARHIAESRCMKRDEAVDTTARSLLAIDVRDAVAGLPDREQTVCRRLLDGESVHEIAKQMGCTWHTIRRLLDGIRERFMAMGLDGWLGT